jgi:hypothetical protein
MGATAIRSELFRVWNIDGPETKPKDLYRVYPKRTSFTFAPFFKLCLPRGGASPFHGALVDPSLGKRRVAIVPQCVAE